jgi:uncharacterized protein (TIGR03000 family)
LNLEYLFSQQTEDSIMFSHLWKLGLASLVGVTLLLTPGTSEAQGKGGGRGGGGGSRGGRMSRSGGNWSGNSGNWSRNGGRAYDNRGYYYGPAIGLGIGLGYPGYYGYGNRYGGYGNSYSAYSPDTANYSYYPDSSYFGNGTQPNYSSSMRNPNDAGFTVRVPDPNAEVWFQDHQTQQRGVVRQYESEPLAQGYIYTFTIRARWNQNGQAMDQTRQINASAGQNLTVDFSAPAPEQIQALPQRQPQQTQPIPQG